jgi:hypothetical protein
MKIPERLVAIDWSGNATDAGQRRHIWIADWSRGGVTLSAGRTRGETIAWVMEAARATPEMVVGFDFSFSLPAWFVRHSGAPTAAALWHLVEAQGEAWQRTCAAPFWGRPGRGCPDDHRGRQWRGYRATERTTGNVTRRLPSSTFQIGGAGAVGTGSLRGMPHLLALARAGFAVWPFEEPRLPVVVEIYPRLFTGRTRVSDAKARAEHLRREQFEDLPAETLAKARNSPDGFDALCTVMGMAEHAAEFADLRCANDADALLEGEIWTPRSMRTALSVRQEHSGIGTVR